MQGPCDPRSTEKASKTVVSPPVPLPQLVPDKAAGRPLYIVPAIEPAAGDRADAFARFCLRLPNAVFGFRISYLRKKLAQEEAKEA